MSMDADEYQKLALRTLDGNLDKQQVLSMGMMGLCSESGEAIDMLIKNISSGREINREQTIKDLGDVAWYLAITAHAIDCDLSEVFQKNIEKLEKRYSNPVN